MLNRSEILLKISELNLCSEETLKLYSEFYKELPKQGSSEWLNNRKIGGSMAASILLKEAKYGNKQTAALDLLGLNDFKGSLVTYWGTLFEEVAKKYLLSYIMLNIYEFGSIPGFENYTSYSPDGIFIANQNLIDEFMLDSKLINQIMLLEIKCPQSREIGEIPAHYIPQMQLGMATIGITNYTLFSEFVFRICSINDFNFSTSCKSIKTKSINSKPFVIGFIGIYNEDFTFKTIDPFVVDKTEHVFEGDKTDLYALGQYIREFESIYSYACEFEKYVVCLKYFERTLVNEYFRINYPAFDYIDFGATPNFLYKSTDTDIELLFEYFALQAKKNNIYLSEQLVGKSECDWDCKEFLASEIQKFQKESLNKNIAGIIPYKLYKNENRVVYKQNYEKEIEDLISFGKEVEEIKKLPSELWLKTVLEKYPIKKIK